MQSTKVIKRRLESIKSTRQLTKAMEMVSTVKMRRAINTMLDNRPFAQKSWEMLGQILTSLQENPALAEHPFFQPADPKNSEVLVILLTDDRGLCGGFHAHLFSEINHALKTTRFPKDHLHFINVGKKGEIFLKKNNFDLIQNYTFRKFLSTDGHQTVVLPIIDYLIQSFGAQQYKQIYLVHTDYVNTFIQRAQIKQILPLSHRTLDKQITDQTFDPDSNLLKDADEVQTNQKDLAAADISTAKTDLTEYKIEPDALTILDELIPFCLAAQIYQALLESHASVESARIMAMRNANNSADDIIQSLKLTYNQVRQGKITQDIAEISAGKAALED